MYFDVDSMTRVASADRQLRSEFIARQQAAAKGVRGQKGADGAGGRRVVRQGGKRERETRIVPSLRSQPSGGLDREMV